MWSRVQLYRTCQKYIVGTRQPIVCFNSTQRLLLSSHGKLNIKAVSFNCRFASTTANSSSSSSQQHTSWTRLLKIGLIFCCGSVALFGVGCIYSTTNSHFASVFTSYIPFASWAVEYLEERDYQKHLRAKEAFYRQDQEVTPYVSRVHTGEYEESYGQANSGIINEDPLAPEYFFNPASGTVGTEIKDYLPLITIPETNEPLITHTALCVNDLISSVNASATSTATVMEVSHALIELANKIEKEYPDHAKRFKLQGEQFAKLNDLYGGQVDEQTKRAYLQMLGRGAVDVERQLVFHVNKRVYSSSPGKSSSSSTPSTNPSTKNQKPMSAGQKLALIMEIQLALTMATSGNHSATPYIESARKALKSQPPIIQKQLVTEALKTVNLPDTDEIDLEEIVNKILK